MRCIAKFTGGQWITLIIICCVIPSCVPFIRPVTIDSSVVRDELFALIPTPWFSPYITTERQPRAVISFQRSFGNNTFGAYFELSQYSSFSEAHNAFNSEWNGIANINWLHEMYVPSLWSPNLVYAQDYAVGCGQLLRGDEVLIDSCNYVGLYGYCVLRFRSHIDDTFITYRKFEQIVSSNVDPIGNTNGCLFVSTPTPILSSTAVP